MTKRTYKPGIMSTGNYIVSGTPFMTGSTVYDLGANQDGLVVEFPSVTKSIVVVNKGNDLSDSQTTSAPVDVIVYFQSREENSDEVVTKHEYMTLQGPDASLSMTIRANKVFVSIAPHAANGNAADGYVEIFAELTGIKEPVAHDQP